MSLTQDHGDFVFQCDGCRALLETNTSNFNAAMNALRRSQWRPVPRPNPNRRFDPHAKPEWNHLCRSCDSGSELPLAHGKTRSENSGASR